MSETQFEPRAPNLSALPVPHPPHTKTGRQGDISRSCPDRTRRETAPLCSDRDTHELSCSSIDKPTCCGKNGWEIDQQPKFGTQGTLHSRRLELSSVADLGSGCRYP